MGYSPIPPLAPVPELPEPEAPPAVAPSTPPEASPPAEASDTLLNFDLTGLVSRLSNISVNGDVGLTVPQVSVDLAGGVSGDACADDVSGGISIDVGASAGTGGSGGSAMPILSLDSETDGVVTASVFGEDGLISSSNGIGSTIGGGDGLALISLDGETDALINAPLLGENGIGGTADFGSLLNAAMIDVGNVGSFSSVIGGEVYDGNVTLAGDLSTALGSTLDLLTTTSSLFDVPALDILGCDGLDG